ncbi:MAG: SpoIIE family protein phosphatase [Waltera sp.]
MIIGKKEQERLEREQCAQISLLCRQKLMGYAESFEELGKSFRQEIQITGEDRQNILEKCMLWQSRQIMGDHLQEVARIMERVAGEELGYCPLEEKKRKSLVQALKSEGIIARDLCYVEKDGSSSGTEAGISMTLSTEKRHYKAAQVADMLTVLLGKKLQVSSGSPYLVEQEPHCFLFTEEPKYIALTGVSRAVKEGEKVSGDQYATMESEKGKLILMLSDGTGSGEDASRGSGRVMDLMEKMLEAGFGTESVNLLNSALYAQNEEDDHPTIDLCSLDLYTGECEICKVGGVATFWKTSGRVLCVGGESLPLGIFQKVQMERQMCQIRPGDLLVMMTDGVLDMMEDGEERMAQVLEGLQEQNPQEIAEKILSYAICASEGRIRDDMTVFVLCLWENT